MPLNKFAIQPAFVKYFSGKKRNIFFNKLYERLSHYLSFDTLFDDFSIPLFLLAAAACVFFLSMIKMEPRNADEHIKHSSRIYCT